LFYGTVRVMTRGAGYVTVPVPVGVTVNVYVRAAGAGVGVELPPPPQDRRMPITEMASAVISTVSARFRRCVNGTPKSTAQNTTVPTLFHGGIGARFFALAVVVIVSVEEPVPLLVIITGVALAEMAEAEPLAVLTLVVKVTVPT
jgi:hypothetical protein